jgi:hypothetical protein
MEMVRATTTWCNTDVLSHGIVMVTVLTCSGKTSAATTNVSGPTPILKHAIYKHIAPSVGTAAHWNASAVPTTASASVHVIDDAKNSGLLPILLVLQCHSVYRHVCSSSSVALGAR